MISAIRKQLMSESFRHVAFVAVIALLAGFILPDIMRFFMGTGEWIVRVNKREIGAKQFARQAAQEQNRIALFREQMHHQYGAQVADALMQMQAELNPNLLAYNYLIRDELMHQVSREIGIHLDEQYIIEKLSDPNFIIQEPNLVSLIPPYVFDELGMVNKKILKDHLRRYGLSVADFEHKVQRALIQKITNEILATASYVPEFDLKQRFNTTYTPKKFSILTVTFDSVLNQEKKKVISDREINQFFIQENNKSKRYWVPEKRSGTVWKFNPELYNIAVSDAQIERNYEDSKMSKYVDQPTKVQVRQLLFPVKSEDDRSEMRKKAERERTRMIENPTLFAQEGELVPFFTRGQKEKPFEIAAFLLENNGDISQVIETEKGYVVLQRVAKQMRTFKPLSAVRSEIKKAIIERKFSDAFMDEARRVITEGIVDQQKLNQFVQLKKAKTETLNNVLASQSQQAQRLFGLKKNSAVYYLDGNMGIIIQLNEIQPSYLPELHTIKTVVKNDMYEKRAEKRLNDLLEKAKNATQQETIQAAKEITGGTLQETGWLKSEDKESLEKLQKQGVPTYQMLQMENTGSVMVHADKDAGYIITLDQVKAIDLDEFNAKKEELGAQLESERLQQLSAGFVASLYRNATIETSEMLTQMT